MKFRFKGGLIFLTFILFSWVSFGQLENYPLSDKKKQILAYSLKNNTHPHLFSTVNFFLKDSVKKKFLFSPIIDLTSGFGLDNQIPYSLAIGAKSQIQLNNRWTIILNYAALNESPEKHIDNLQDSLGIALGVGYTKQYKDNTFSHYYSGVINYKASEYFDFELGRSKNFWGDGYRSLILSNNASPYPYLKINTKVWNIRYVNLWAQMQERFDDDKQYKYIAFHALSWNITSQLNVSFYESVIWQSKDSINSRGLDINYFNPVIFYRPVEHALGSADNVLVGASVNYQINKKTLVYSQILLDEFLFKEVKARSGWWANKYGLQIGIKAFNFFNSGIDIQTELNYARPFTYSHGSVLQNYGHQHQSIAHPLETNFVEWTNNIRFSKEKWEINNNFIWAIFGRDEYGKNQGGTIYKPYTNVENIYGNYLAQGRKKTIVSNRLTFDRFINDKRSMRIGLTNLCRYEGNNSENELNIYLFLQVKFNPIPRNFNR